MTKAVMPLFRRDRDESSWSGELFVGERNHRVELTITVTAEKRCLG